ncbi:MAG: hypothetical protein M1827_005685 [Pycnora praestabilis]|nr:MAG: hypothetical protein M1827_005685 [Pycnora praestabilis]
MDSYRQLSFCSSPESSEGSQRGTPETKVTVFSPEETRSSQRAGLSPEVAKKGSPPTFSLDFVQSIELPSFTGSRYARAVSAGSKPSAFHLFGSQDLCLGGKDPFVSNESRSGVLGLQKLSPTASAFTPGANSSDSVSLRSLAHQDYTVSASKPRDVLPLGVSYLNATSIPDTADAGGDHLRTYLNSVAIESPPTTPKGQRSASSPSTLVKVEGSFSTDGVLSRSLVIERISNDTSEKELQDFFDVQLFPSLKGLSLVELHSTRTIYIAFTDMRDSERAYHAASDLRPHWKTQYLTPNRFAQKHLSGNALFVSAYEGQVIVKAHFTGPRQQFSAKIIHQLVYELLENYGHMKAFVMLDMEDLSYVGFRAEFYDTKAADAAAVTLNGFRIGGCSLSTGYHEPELGKYSHHCLSPLVVGSERHDSSALETALGSLSLGQSKRQDGQLENFSATTQYNLPSSGERSVMPYNTYHVHKDPRYEGSGYSCPHRDIYAYPSPCGGQGYPSYAHYGPAAGPWEQYGPGAIGQERGQPRYPQYQDWPVPQQNQNGPWSPQRRGPHKAGGRQNNDRGAGHHNVVDVERIRRGLDVRTTIMLRNIPNKVDQAMLKEIVDETSFGKYDFMYLRIDFANNCNVGYAFINFEDPWFIIEFVTARAGFRWNRYNSDKVAEVSYATIQGKDCLVQKFRNSSVMLEHPTFRPKIFHIGNGPLAGTEDAFPGPDNPSKMRRSVENAEHVGLFAPRAGQHFRDEQRRRRSQYDRGTRLAELEEAYEYAPPDYPANEYHHRGALDDDWHSYRAPQQYLPFY